MKFDFCPRCGRQHSVKQEDLSKYSCGQCGWEFWNNPKATVAVVFLKDGQALFAKRAIEPDKGKYDFPGGFTDYGEDVYDACVREVEEETTVQVKRGDLRLVTGYTREYLPGTSVVDLIFSVKTWQGEFKARDDVAALEWKPLAFIKDKAFAPQEYADLVERLASTG